MYVTGPPSWNASRIAGSEALSAAAPEPLPSTGAETELAIPVEELAGDIEFEKAHFLIHPATADEFRILLEEILATLPQGPLASMAQVGYQIHVIDQSGLHPCTLEFSRQTARDWRSGSRPFKIDPQTHWRQLLEMEGIRQDSLVEGYCQELSALNPDLSRPENLDSPLGRSQVELPIFRYYGGQMIHWEAHEFITLPERTYVAAMVLNAPIEGIEGCDRKVVFWDPIFRRHHELRPWYILHELGHCLDYAAAFLRPDWRRQWQTRLREHWSQMQQDQWITRYCKESPEEYFAEAFAAWASTQPANYSGDFWNQANDLEQQRLGQCYQKLLVQDPVAVDLIEEIVERFS